jgi:hypothetical protein
MNPLRRMGRFLSDVWSEMVGRFTFPDRPDAPHAITGCDSPSIPKLGFLHLIRSQFFQHLRLLSGDAVQPQLLRDWLNVESELYSQ